MVITVVDSGPDHGFCNAGGLRADRRVEVRAAGGPLTNLARRAILKARVRPGWFAAGCITSGSGGK